MNRSEGDRKQHWETIYKTKPLNQVSWYQPIPYCSLDLIQKSKLPKNAKIIDIGGGDSLLADHLLDLGYNNVSVLDVSETAIERAKKRLGKSANEIDWIVSDVSTFKPTQSYDLWHDRAAFHFLTEEEEVKNYVNLATKSLQPKGTLILGTFSEQGPKKCSGIEIKQYSSSKLSSLFSKKLTCLECVIDRHRTPSGNSQEFVFCRFQKDAGA